MPRHVDLTPLDGIHGVVAGLIADATEQAAGIVRDHENPAGRALRSTDVGKVFQRSDSGTWLGLYSLAPLSFWVVGGGASTSFSHVLTQDLDVDGFNIADAGAYLPRVISIPYASTVNVNVGVRCAHTIAPLNGDIAIVLTNPITGASGTIELRQDGVGGRDITGITCAGRTIKMPDSPGTLQIDQTALAVSLLSYEVRADYVLIAPAAPLVDATYGAPSSSGGGGAALSNVEPPAIGSGGAGDTLTAARGNHTHDLGGIVSGDLGGTLPAPTVTGFQGRPFLSTAPASGQAIRWNGSAWAPASDGGVGGSFVTSALTFASTISPNFAGVDRYTLTLTGPCTISAITGVPEHGCQLAVTQSGGPHSLTWPSSVKRPVGELLAPHATGTTMYSLSTLGGAIHVARAPAFEDNASGGSSITGTAAGVFAGLEASGSGGFAESVWSTLSVMSIVDPMNHGAAGNGTTNDTAALEAAIAALPSAGGIVYLPAGRSFRKTTVINTDKDHLKFWAPNRQAEIFGDVGSNGDNVQAIFSLGTAGFGFFGVKFRSNATTRGGTGDDHMVTAGEGTSTFEMIGCEIDGSRAAGIFMLGATDCYINGNYVHRTQADHIHHTLGTRDSWCWDNWIYNSSPTLGDDGIACVTYGGEALTGDLEWWDNFFLGNGWGRGYTVVGGENVNIHHNWAIGAAGAGILVATEPAFDSEGVQNVTIRGNGVTQCGHTIEHPGILISGLHAPAGPIDNVDLIDNVSAGNENGNYATEGSITNLTSTGLSENIGDLPPLPTVEDVTIKDTSILKTRDVSHVTSGSRPGLYRIHVRQHPSGTGFQQRFEYVVKGTPSNVSAWIATRTAAGDYLSEQQTVSGTAYALLLCASPVTLGSGVSAVTHTELRSKDQAGVDTTLSWLWNRINSGTYFP